MELQPEPAPILHWPVISWWRFLLHSFVQAFSKIGLIPDCGGTFFLPRLVGLQKATALMMLGDKISAAEAERMGMIYACFEETDFAEKTHQTRGNI